MNKTLLVIDTNILSHGLTENKKTAFSDLFGHLEEQYRFVVTGFTQFELTCSSDKTHRNKIINYIRDEMTYMQLSDTLMDFSSRICFLYGQHPSTKGCKISYGDIINAAFSIAKDCHLLTIDNNDYPRPFFREVNRYRVSFTSKSNKEAIEVCYALAPDSENIKHCFSWYDI